MADSEFWWVEAYGHPRTAEVIKVADGTTLVLIPGCADVIPDDKVRMLAVIPPWNADEPAPQKDVDDIIRSVLEHAVDGMGWPEIKAFHAELARGQDITEDAGGFMLRAIRRLFGLPTNVRTVETYQAAARAMIRGVA